MKNHALSLNLIQTLRDHRDTVWDLAWHPSGKYLASCGTDKIVRIWKEESKDKWVNTVGLDEGHTRTIRCISWSPDGKLLASVGFDAKTSVWEMTNDGFENIATLEGHDNEVKSCSFSSTGTFLATCGRDKTVWIWEIDEDNEFECSGVLNSHSQDVKKVAWHPTKMYDCKFFLCFKILLSTSYDNTCQIHTYSNYDEDWETVENLPGHESTVWSARFKPTPSLPNDLVNNNSNTLMPNIDEIELDENPAPLTSPDVIASVSADQTLKIWSDYTTNYCSIQQDTFALSKYSKWKCHLTIKGLHDRPIYDMDWHPKLDIIATCGGDNSISLVQLDTPSILASDAHIANHIEEKNLTNNNVVNIINNNSDNNNDCKLGELISPYYNFAIINNAHSEDINAIRFNPQRPDLLATASDDGTIKIWRLDT